MGGFAIVNSQPLPAQSGFQIVKSAPLRDRGVIDPAIRALPGGDTAADLLEGAGGSLAEHAVNVYDLLRKIPGADKVLPDSSKLHAAIKDATPDTTPAHVGSFLEGTAEFMIPAAKAAEATKGASLLTRAAAQGGVGGGVSAVQSGGDPAATATGAVLGAGGELAGAAVSGGRKLLQAKSPTLANFSESFGGATPTQKARISRALDVLARDGVVPPGSVHETQDAIKARLEDIGKQYDALDPAIRTREVDPSEVVDHLREMQKQYTRRGVVTDRAAYSTINQEIGKVEQIAMKNGGTPAAGPSTIVGPNGQPMRGPIPAVPGKVNVDDVIHLKQEANGRTNFNSPDADKSLWNGIGNAYRAASDSIAPEITPLNRDYQKYKDLEQIIDQNIARGKGVSPSGLSILEKRAGSRVVGAAIGGTIGAPLGPLGAAGGAAAGGFFGPKVAKATAQAIQNAIDSGAFAKLAPARQQAIRSMAAIGDNAGILRILGVSSAEATATQ